MALLLRELAAARAGAQHRDEDNEHLWGCRAPARVRHPGTTDGGVRLGGWAGLPPLVLCIREGCIHELKDRKMLT